MSEAKMKIQTPFGNTVEFLSDGISEKALQFIGYGQGDKSIFYVVGDPDYFYGWIDFRDTLCQSRLSQDFWKPVDAKEIKSGAVKLNTRPELGPDNTVRLGDLMLVKQKMSFRKEIERAELLRAAEMTRSNIEATQAEVESKSEGRISATISLTQRTEKASIAVDKEDPDNPFQD